MMSHSPVLPAAPPRGARGIYRRSLALGLDQADIGWLERAAGCRRRVPREERLFRMDQPFRNLYAIRFGHFKTYQFNSAGEQQITGFQMAGELLGLDALSGECHQCDAAALEDSEVCEIPFANLELLFAREPELLRRFHRIMGQEITREQDLLLLLGNMRAEQRFAVFLINLSARYAARGYSPTCFQLRMSREDIGNYLGLTIESISRLMSRFKQQGLLKVDKREVTLVQPAALEALAAGAGPASPIG
jgi:CRP/FNR family transcriptional regulator